MHPSNLNAFLYCYKFNGTCLGWKIDFVWVVFAWQGYRVLVVEQTETPDQLDIRRREEGSKDKVWKFTLIS